jgi:predicted alpha/beta-fold hydrolase
MQAMKGHLQTVIPYLFRKVKLPESENIEITLSDGDFVDAEFWKGSEEGLAILTHGLEGSSKAVYVRALAQSYLKQGWNVLAWNFRGCSGRMNRLERLYHSGAYEDLQDVIRFGHSTLKFSKIHLAGFSLGGNMTLLALGKESNWLKIHGVERAIIVSPPVNLAASSAKLEKWWNTPYRINFLRDLKSKIRLKAKQFPGYYRLAEMEKATTIFTFDDVCTAPVHGFKGAADYYHNCSSIYHIREVTIPTMVVIAKNDPMLARGNYDDIEFQNPLVQFQIMEEGGHCGFWGLNVY